MAAFQTYAHLSRCGFTVRRMYMPWVQADGNVAGIHGACNVSTDADVTDPSAAATLLGCTSSQHAKDAGKPSSSGHHASGGHQDSLHRIFNTQTDMYARMQSMCACELCPARQAPPFRFALFQQCEGHCRKDPPLPNAVVCIQKEQVRCQGLGLSDSMSAVEGVPEGIPVCFSYVVGSDVFFVQCAQGLPVASLREAQRK
jgi:hypothetical protein